MKLIELRKRAHRLGEVRETGCRASSFPVDESPSIRAADHFLRGEVIVRNDLVAWAAHRHRPHISLTPRKRRRCLVKRPDAHSDALGTRHRQAQFGYRLGAWHELHDLTRVIVATTRLGHKVSDMLAKMPYQPLGRVR